MKTRLYCVLSLCFCIVFLLANTTFAAEDPMVTSAKQAYIVDSQTGAVLLEKNSDEKMPTSSMSKVMTMYLVFDALKNGSLSLDDELLVSEKAWNKGGSKMFVPLGEKVKVLDLIKGVTIQSGNDATIVFAEGLAGSEDAFAAALNRKAKELGMNNSHFMNASGWPDPDHYSTAHDLAILAKATINNFPEYYHYYSEMEYTYNGIRQTNRNPLLYRDIGADGLKTGHTEIGGYGLIGTGVKDGRRVIMVLNGLESNAVRSEETARLLQWALNSFHNVALFDEQTSGDLDKIPVVLGEKSEVAVRAARTVDVTLPALYENDLKVEIEYKSPLKAPVQKGQDVGVVRVHIPKGDVVEVPLIAAEDVPEMGGIMKWITKARILTTGQGMF